MTEVKYNIGGNKEIIAEYDENGFMEITRECFEALIEKQIPIKPIALDKDREYCKCQICGEYVTDYCGNRMKYCCECGQKLDWGNENDRAD